MSTWQELETRFREIEAQLRSARLDHQAGADGEYWRVAAAFDPLATSRFEAISRLAGKKLLQVAGSEQQLPEELRGASTDAVRWYRAIKLYSGHYHYGSVGYETNPDGTHRGTIITGHISSPASVAINLCLEMSAMAADPETPTGPLTINVSGTNARVNLGSIDNSSNSAVSTTTTVFDGLRSAIPTQVDAELRSELLSRIDEMERSVGTKTFFTRYNDFIQSAANHLAVFTPFLPALTALFQK